MRLRAQITVDIAASDFIQAADHQTRLSQFVENLKLAYPEAHLSIKERRERKPESEPDLDALAAARSVSNDRQPRPR